MDETKELGTAQGRVDLISNIFRLLREALLVIVLLLLFFWPSGINSMLQSAGFTEADFGWIKWQIEESNAQTSDALATVDKLMGQIDTMQIRLATVQETELSPEVRHQVDSVVQGIRAIELSTAQVDKSLTQSYENNRDLLEQVQQKSPSLQEIRHPSTDMDSNLIRRLRPARSN